VALADPCVPLVLSHHIVALQPDFFWLGGGEVDLKLGFSCRQFVQVWWHRWNLWFVGAEHVIVLLVPPG